MAKTKQGIINDIANHMSGIPPQECYIGIISDPKGRLFTDHSVNQNTGRWIHRPAGSHTVARGVEQHFLNVGWDGGGGGGDATSTNVYAYRKTSSTKP